jgi:hypothetical protein
MLCTSQALTAAVKNISVFRDTKSCIPLAQPSIERHVRKRHSSFRMNLFRIMALSCSYSISICIPLLSLLLRIRQVTRFNYSSEGFCPYRLFVALLSLSEKVI